MSDLALLGGLPLRPQGPPDWPLPDDEIRQALDTAYRDNSWGKYHGGRVEELEASLARYHGVSGVLTCGSGTYAVELALHALKVEPGDEVLMSAYDYPGNFLTIHALGAVPVLLDVDPHNWNLSLEHLEAACSEKSHVLLVSHLHGGVVPMKALRAIAERKNLKILEDVCQCPGAWIEGRRAGTWGDVGVLSFGGSKLLSAGRGGALLTSDAAILQRARTRQLRGNLVCPLSELQAAVLLPQPAKLDARNEHRLASVGLLAEALHEVPGLRLFENACAESRPGFYKVGLQYDAEAFGLSRALLVKAMRAEGFALDEGFRALHVGRSPSRFRRVGSLAEAEKAHASTLILHHPILLGEAPEVRQIAVGFAKVWTHRAALARATE